MTLRRRLLLLMLAVLLPTAALFAWIVVAAYQRQIDAERQHLRETVRALALVVDREFDKRAAIARTLAITSGLIEGDHRRFYDEARAATQGTGDWVVLGDGEHELVDTSVLFGTPLPAPSWRMPPPRADGAPQVSSLHIDPVSRRPMLQVVAPVPKVEPAHFSVSVAFRPDALQAILTEQHLPSGWVAAILDREYHVVARTPDPELWLGKRAQPDLAEALKRQGEGFMETVTLDGVPVRTYYALSPVHGWAIAIGVPQQALAAAARRSAWAAGVLAALLGAFALALASWSARRIRRPIEALERAAHELGQDRVPVIEPTGLDEADAVGAALHRAGLQAAQINDELERRVAAALEAARSAQARNEELQRVLAEELLHLITDNLPVLIAYADREGRYRLNNKAYETWFGRPRSEITGKLVREVVGVRSWADIGPRLEAALAGQTVQFETTFHYPGIGTRHIDAVYVPHRGPGDAVKGVAILVQDVSARYRAHQELRRAEEAQRLLVSLHDASRGVRDPVQLQGEITRRVARHFGVSRCSYLEIDASGEWALIERDHAEGLPSIAGRHRMADFSPALLQTLRAGRTVVVDDVQSDPRTAEPTHQAAFADLHARAVLCVPLLKEGRPAAAFALLHHAPRRWTADEAALFEQLAERTWFVVENARTESQLRESRNVLSLAMRGGRMGAWSRDLVSERVWWSRELEEIFGLPPGGFAGTTEGFRALVHPDDRPRLETSVAEALACRADYSVEFRFRHASGQWRWMDGRGRAVYDAQGRPTMLYGIGIDITARRANEEEMRRLNEELAAAHRRKDEFLATLAHELRNPLAPITNALEILRRKDPGDPAALRWTRDIIDRQVRQMTRLVDDLLDVARITRGRIELKRERVALAPVVHAAVESARPFIESAHHDLELRLPQQPLWLDADPMRLTQVLLNLLNNAAKYTPPGGRITLTVQARDGQAEVAVRDSGIGLAPEHLATVFEMFSQVAPALERSQGGLGIGLALARGLVELHGGSIEARSDGLGHGTEFLVRLPLAAERAQPPHEGPAAPHPVAPLRVLVVDDNRDAAESLGALLRLSGHEVLLAYDGESALTLGEAFHPALALLDIGMPGMNGYELAQRMRQRPWGKHVVLAAVSGWGQHEDKRRAFEAGFDHHLTKPVDADALDSVLQGAAEAAAPRPPA
ncbi:MAG: ATP-binding protein [Pseudomonadota bacterium]